MSDSACHIELALSNGDFFTNSLTDDIMVRPTYATQRILLGTSNGATSPLVVTSNAIGIMNDNPAYTLDVAGNVNFTGTLNQNGAPYIGSQWSNSGSNVFLLGSNVGIGKTNPLYPLDIEGSFRSTGSFFGVGTSTLPSTQIQLVASNSAQTRLYAYGADGKSYLQHQGDLNICPVGTTTSTRLYIQASTGNFGNTTTPNEKFHIASGKIYSDTQHLGSSNDSAAVPAYSFKEDSNTGMFHPAGSNNTLGFSTGGTERVRITSNGNVGIGTSTPLYTLDVNGVVNASTFSGATITSLSNLGLYGSNTSVAVSNIAVFGSNTSVSASNTAHWSSNNMVNKNGDTMIGTLYTPSIGINTISTTENLDVTGNIKSSSNVYVMSRLGVGTSNPFVPVHVVGDMRVEGNLDVNGIYNTINTDVQVTDQFTVSNNGTGPALNVYQMGAQAIADFYDDSNIAMRIADGGNVGIGTSNPSFKLDVRGSLGITNVGATKINLGNDATNNRHVVLFDNTGNQHQFYGFGVNSSVLRYQVNGGASHVFFAGTSSGASTELMRIRGSDGFVGIGDSTPSYKLDVTGDINFIGSLRSNGNIVTFSQWTSSNANVYIGSGSNAGIGTIAPAYTLDVNGDINFTGDLYSNGTAVSFSQWSNNSSNVFILSSNVGIGTSSPSNPLDVSGNMRATGNGIFGNGTINSLNGVPTMGLVLTSSTQSITGAPHIVAYVNNGTYPIYQQLNYTANNIAQTYDAYFSSPNWIASGTSAPFQTYKFGSKYLINYATPTTAGSTITFNTGISLTSNGNVGIATSSPQHKLDVYGDVNLRVMPNLGSGVIRIGRNTDNIRYHEIYCENYNISAASNRMIFRLHDPTVSASNTRDVMALTGSGNVGIGTSNPSYNLHVAGDINFTGGLYSNGVPFVGGGGSSSQWTSSGANVYVGSGSNVGINTTSPSYTLDVNGYARIENTYFFNDSVPFGNTSTNRRYALLATLNANQGYAMIEGIAGGHTGGTGQGKAKFRIVIDARDSIVMGNVANINGNTAHGIALYKNTTTNEFTAYLTVEDYTRYNIKISVGDGVTVSTSLSWSADAAWTTPSGTALWFDSVVHAPTNSLGTDFYMSSAATPVYSITKLNSGYVGIGTSNPSYKLDVNGTARSTLQICGNGTTTSLNGAPTTNGLILTSSTQTTMAGPHMSIYINNSTYPVYQLLPYAQDIISQCYDSYYDGTVFKASGTSAAFQTYKTSSQYQINYATPTTAGATISFQSGLAVNSNGNVGIGTTSPSYKVDVNGYGFRVQGGTGTTPTVFYLNSTGSASTTSIVQFVNNSHYIACTDSNWNSFGKPGSGHNIYYVSGGHVFYGSPYFISNVGIGTASPSYALHVVGNIYASGDITGFSDIRLKSNIKVIDSALAKLHTLGGYTFNVQDSDRIHTGLIAQEVQKVLPEAVYEEEKADGTKGHLSIAYGNMAGLLVEAIKEVDNKYKDKVHTLEQQVASLTTELAQLKQFIQQNLGFALV